MDPHARLRVVLGRDLGPEETARIERLRKLFELRDNDALWTVFVMFEHYNLLSRDWRAAPVSGLRKAVASLATVGLAAALLLAGLCLCVGAALQTSTDPVWAASVPGAAAALPTVVRSLLGAPVGWLVPLLFVLPAYRAAKASALRLIDQSASRAQRARAGGFAAAVWAFYLGWSALMLRLAA